MNVQCRWCNGDVETIEHIFNKCRDPNIIEAKDNFSITGSSFLNNDDNARKVFEFINAVCRKIDPRDH